MLALAKRHVVLERVETLIKVGLGDRGKVRDCQRRPSAPLPDHPTQTDLTLAR